MGEKMGNNDSWNKRNLRRLNCKVTAQTLWNLHKLAKMAKCGDNVGKVIDKIVKEKMLSLRDFGGK